MKQKIKFGTGGWRAIIGDDFTKENVQRVAAGISMYAYKQRKMEKPIVVGYDNRFLSEDAAKWATEMLVTHGFKVLFIDVAVPTPLVMHMVQSKGLHFGIMITASHNPYNYNGIKFFVDEGRDAPIEVTNDIEEIVNDVNPKVYALSMKEALKHGFVEIVENPFYDFEQSILSTLDVEAIKQSPLRVVIDPMNGSGYTPLCNILNELNCKHDAIHIEKDAYFSGRVPAPSKNTLTQLQTIVVEGGYDLGIALDGDGDRLGIIDSNGQYITANEILCLLYYYLVQHKGWKGPVVRNCATTHMLDKIAESFGEKCYEVPIGFKHVSSKIDEVNAVLGGESSGGLTVRGHIHGKDSIYAAALFVEMVSEMGMHPSQMLEILKEFYGSYVMVENNLKFESSKKSTIEKLIMVDKQLPTFEDEIVKVSYEDGCKVYFEDGFVICRFSGTEPLLRIFAESTSEERAQAYINTLKQYLKIN